VNRRLKNKNVTKFIPGKGSICTFFVEWLFFIGKRKNFGIKKEKGQYQKS